MLRLVSRLFSSKAAGGGLVQVSVSGKIATVTLNQPDKLNALTVKMGDEFVGRSHAEVPACLTAVSTQLGPFTRLCLQRSSSTWRITAVASGR